MNLSHWLTSLFLAFYAMAAVAKPVVVSSIKPIQFLVDAVAGDAVDSQVLLLGMASPHDFQWRPSSWRRLQAADLIVWVGPNLEYFMQRPIAALSSERSLSLCHLKNLSQVAYNDRHHHDSHGDSGHDDGCENDPHIWLNPRNAVLLAAAIADKLAMIDPQNADMYQRNAQAFQVSIHKLDEVIANRLKGVPSQSYIVLHDAYGHFEQRYGVQHAASVALIPERNPGAKHLMVLDELLASGQVICVFQEPQFQTQVIDRLIADRPVAVATLDPLASTIESSPQAYEEFMRTFSEEFRRCTARPLETV